MVSRPSGWAVAALACISWAMVSCAALGPCDTSDDGNPPDEYRQGTVLGGVYMSSPWTGPLLPFAGGKRYDIVHYLGCVPRQIHLWVAFSPDGIRAGSMAPSAGNMSIIQLVDDRIIRIKNDTCSDLYVLVTASGALECGQDAGTLGDVDAAGSDSP